MKLGEMVYWEKFLYEVIEFIGDTVKKHGCEPVRVEIHSLDDPWSTERPEGWGPGCWFEFRDHGVPRKAIALRTFNDNFGGVCKAITVDDGNLWTVPIKGITSYGPRAEVPR